MEVDYNNPIMTPMRKKPQLNLPPTSNKFLNEVWIDQGAPSECRQTHYSLLHALKGYLTCSVLISSLCFIVYKYRSFYEVTKSSEILYYSFFAEENCSTTRMKSLRTVLLRLQTARSYTKQSFTQQRHRKLLAWYM